MNAIPKTKHYVRATSTVSGHCPKPEKRVDVDEIAGLPSTPSLMRVRLLKLETQPAP